MKRFEELLERELTRKEFLIALFGITISLVSVPAIIGMFSKSSSSQPGQPGYGERSYGP
jgi:hypothetical protein